MPSTPPVPRNSTRRPRPKARAKPQPRPHPSDRRAGTSLQSAERHTRETLSHAKPGCSQVWPFHDWSKSETSDLDVGEGGEASGAQPSRVRGCSFKQIPAPHPVLAFGSDHPLPQGERGKARGVRLRVTSVTNAGLASSCVSRRASRPASLRRSLGVQVNPQSRIGDEGLGTEGKDFFVPRIEQI